MTAFLLELVLFTHHMHIEALRVFPPRFKIPQYLMKQIDHARLQRLYKTYSTQLANL